MKTVKQLAELAGVSERTLRWYDKIGLLEPSRSGGNGYRLYGEKELLLLQQILFYRELGLPLGEIARIVKDPGFAPVEALQSHRAALTERIDRLQRLAKTVDETIGHLKDGTTMNEKKLFEAFSDKEQEALAAEAETLYDPETVKESNRRWKGYSKEKRQSIMDEGNGIYAELAKAMPKGANAPEAQALIERWREHMNHFLTPALDQLEGLADMYASDPRFKANFEAFAPGLAEFMGQAVGAYVKEKKGN